MDTRVGDRVVFYEKLCTVKFRGKHKTWTLRRGEEPLTCSLLSLYR